MLLSTPQYNPKYIASDFTLKDVISQQQITLFEQNASNGFVVAFISNHCPYVQAIISEFVEVAKKLQENGIIVFAVMSNNYEFVQLDSPENMTIFAQQNDFSFPYLVDESQNVARAYDAVCTPDFFGFNADRKMRFRGNISQLESAMNEIAKTGETTVNQEPSQGCSIKWK